MSKPLATNIPTLEDFYGKEEVKMMAKIATFLVQSNRIILEKIEKCKNAKND